MRASSNVFRTAAMVAALLLGASLLVVALSARSAQATFPGTPNAIAFTSDMDKPGDFQVYRMGSDGFGVSKLSDSAGLNTQPAFSADGFQIAFTNENAAAGTEVFTMFYEGSAEKNVTNRTGNDQDPAWFPSGNRIAFTSDRSGGNRNLYYQRVDDTGAPVGNPVRLTSNPASDEEPAVSPDGTKIAFVSSRDGDPEIFVMKAQPESATNRARQLTHNNVFDENPDWSPSGKKIVFEGFRQTDREIFSINPDGTLQRNLTNNDADDVTPAYSPDGKKIAFSSNRDGDYEIYRMRADGSDAANAQPLTVNDNAQDDDPSWQPIP